MSAYGNVYGQIIKIIIVQLLFEAFFVDNFKIGNYFKNVYKKSGILNVKSMQIRILIIIFRTFPYNPYTSQ